MVQFESMSIAAVELRVLLRQKIECLEELYISWLCICYTSTVDSVKLHKARQCIFTTTMKRFYWNIQIGIVQNRKRDSWSAVLGKEKARRKSDGRLVLPNLWIHNLHVLLWAIVYFLVLFDMASAVMKKSWRFAHTYTSVYTCAHAYTHTHTEARMHAHAPMETVLSYLVDFNLLFCLT